MLTKADVFSALDTLTSRWVLDHLFKGDLMKDRTVLLITHHVAFAAPIADFLVAMEEDGTVGSAGLMDQERHNLPDEDDQASAESPGVETKKSELSTEAKPEEQKTAAKLVQAEEKSEGRISRKALFSFFS